MEALIIINLILSVLALGFVLFLTFKPKSEASIDKEAIRSSVVQAIAETNQLVTNSIASSNNTLASSLKEQIERI